MPTQINLGRIRLNFCGVYSKTVAYAFNDVVSYLSGCYVCISATGSIAGTLPTDTTKWVLLVAAPTEPSGVVKMWYGNSADVPEGWAICDGTNGTPNLSNKFVMGASSSYATGTIGGNTSITPTITVQGTALTIAQTPAHDHVINSADVFNTAAFVINDNGGDTIVSSDNAPAMYATYRPNRYYTGVAGGGQSHSHGATSSAVPTIPPFVALYYIMKL